MDKPQGIVHMAWYTAVSVFFFTMTGNMLVDSDLCGGINKKSLPITHTYISEADGGLTNDNQGYSELMASTVLEAIKC